MKAVLVISPHLDDAVLSAGQFMAGRKGDVDVLTVFSGIPMEAGLITSYDKSCGFSTSKDAMVVRREEDREALALLGANAIYTDRLDSQYKGSPNVKMPLINMLNDIVRNKDYEYVLAPLGLRHPDHIAVSNSALRMNIKNLYLYEDIPTRVQYPELVFERLQGLPYSLELEFIGDGSMADKARALWCYKSQIAKGDLDPYLLFVPERFHHVKA